jgi:hypothetical protein
MSLRIASLFAAAFGAITLLSAAGTAQAFPDAKVETQLRPDFGLLLKPHLRHHHHRAWGYGGGGCVERCGGGYVDGGYAGGPPYGPGYPERGPHGPFLDAASVDCNDPAQGARLAEIVTRLNPGGTLILKPGAACVATVFIDKPITIEGQGDRPYGKDVPIGSDHRQDVELGVAQILSPPEGNAPCIVVRIQDGLANDPEHAVVLRNLALVSDKANDESCLDIERGVVRIETAMIDYQGHGAAIYVGDGELISGDRRGEEDPSYDQGARRDRVFIQAPLAEEAIDVQGGEIHLRDTTVQGGNIGINFESLDKGSTVDASAFVMQRSEEAGRAFDPGSSGISVQGRGHGAISIRDSFICGYGIGVFMEAANVVHLDNNSICQAGKGIYAAGGQFSATNNYIAATNIGIQIGAASPISVTGNGIYGTANDDRHGRGGDYFIYIEPGGSDAGVSGNFFYSAHGICEWREVDDGYFHGRRRPWGNEWRRWHYMPHGGHGSGYGICKDPADFNIDEEAYWFGDNARQVYGVQDWPGADDRVEDPFDGYDWNHPWRRHDHHDGPGGPSGDHHY